MTRRAGPRGASRTTASAAEPGREEASVPTTAQRGPATKLFIATPTADSIMLAGYVEALVRLSDRLDESGIRHSYHTVDGADLVVQRNQLTASFLASDCSHLLFIDSDMAFPPNLAHALLAADKAVIGTVYPKRILDVATLRRWLGARAFPDALALTYSWNVRVLGRSVAAEDGVCRVDGLGGGFLLIRRDCFDTLLAQTDVPYVIGDARRPKVRAFFRDMPLGDEVLDLDYAFCRRWIDCGGEVWALPSADIHHCGDDRAGVPFARALGALERGGTVAAGELPLLLSSSLLPG